MRITKENLTRYDQHFKSWHRRRLGCANALENWHQTEEAGAVAFYPVGGTPLEGAVKFSFKETPPASGDKSPSNPSTITGASQAKIGRCGKNLFNVHGTLFQTSPFTITDDDFLELSRTNDTNAQQYSTHLIVPSLSIQSNETYTLVVEIKEISNCNVLFNMRDSYGQRGQLNTGYVLYNTVGTYFKICTNNNLYNPNCILRVMISSNPGDSYSLKVRFSIIEGIVDSSNFEYVPYSGNDYTLSLGDTYYGGEIDLATGLMTVTWWGEYVSTITNTELASTYVRTTLATTYGHMGSGSAPTYFRSNYDDNGTYVYPRYSAGTARISISLPYEMLDLDPSTATEQTAKSAVESFLAQHPCFVVYKLYTPQTIQLSPLALTALAQTSRHEPRLNTVYTDADSIQITYQKSPIRAATEQEMAILGLGGNV